MPGVCFPSDLPHWQTVYGWFSRFRDSAFREDQSRPYHGRSGAWWPRGQTAAIIDSQSVKTTESGGPRGYNAGKNVKGRTRHAFVDTDDRALLVEPHTVDIQDRDAGGPLLQMAQPFFRGWGAWIRTREWRYQKPLPYRLATPQQIKPKQSVARPYSRFETGAQSPNREIRASLQPP